MLLELNPSALVEKGLFYSRVIISVTNKKKLQNQHIRPSQESNCSQETLDVLIISSFTFLSRLLKLQHYCNFESKVPRGLVFTIVLNSLKCTE